MRILSKNQRYEIYMLLKHGFSQHRISKKLGIHRLTIRRYQRQWALGQSVPGWPPGNSEQQAHLPDGTGGAVGCPVDESVPPRPPGNNGDSAAEQKAGIAQPSLGAKRIITQSACERYRDFIEQQTGHGRNAQAIYQDLVDGFGFSCKYNSVKRFVKKLKAVDPKRFDILEFAPGEEAQVDYGQGALTVYSNGKMKRPYLFVMTLKYSGKCYREVVWHTNQETWAKLHEKAFRHLGGCPRYVVLDNLKEGVIKPDIYEPELNATYAAMLQHYGVVAQPCRVRDPNRRRDYQSSTVVHKLFFATFTTKDFRKIGGKRFKSCVAFVGFLKVHDCLHCCGMNLRFKKNWLKKDSRHIRLNNHFLAQQQNRESYESVTRKSEGWILTQ
jgi:hypothetical protein